MSTTPRTDSNTIAGTVILHNGQCTAQMVSSSFARQLETELNAMKVEFEKIILLAAQAADRNVELRRRAEKAEAELARAHDIINRASVQFFHDGSDGETAAKMLTVLNEAKA
jgi:hypothetical protein